MIGQILAAGVGFGDAEAAGGAVHIPTHEVGGIVDIVAARAAVAGGLLIFFPGSVQSLTVAVGRALPANRDDAERILMRRAGVADEFQFLINRGHLHGNRDAPTALGPFHCPKIGGPLTDDAAGIVEVARGGVVSSPTGRDQHQDAKLQKPVHGCLVFFDVFCCQFKAIDGEVKQGLDCT